MSPFIVTAIQPPSPPNYSRSGNVVSRLAVATLEEVARPIFEYGDAQDWDEQTVQETAAAVLALPESGGTVGPLPDGTTIQVEPVRWIALANAEADISGWTTDTDWQTRVLAAFNAKHAHA